MAQHGRRHGDRSDGVGRRTRRQLAGQRGRDHLVGDAAA
jgi:hypothetical protein